MTARQDPQENHVKPYERLDGADNELKIAPGLPGCAEVSVKEPGGDHAFAQLAADDVPSAALALYEAAGLPAPLMVDLPEYSGGIEYAGRGDRGAYTGRTGAKVTIGCRHGEPAELDPDEALKFAARIVVNAEAAKRGEPDPAAVNELADLIEREDYDLDYQERYGLARAVLLAGWKRETDSAR